MIREGRHGVLYSDTWTVKRLTISPVRYEHFNAMIKQWSLPGRLCRRWFPRLTICRLKDVTPRLGIVYDLFGNGGRRSKSAPTACAADERASPRITIRCAAAATRDWFDVDLVQNGHPLGHAADRRRRHRAGQRDRAEQRATFGVAIGSRLPIKETNRSTVSVQHQLFNGLSLTFG